MRKLITLISVLLITVLLFGQSRVTTAEVNFRATPQFADNIIGKIPKGTVLSPLNGIGPYNNWLPIEYNGKTGYVNLIYVKQKTIKTRSSITYHNSQKLQHGKNSLTK